MRLKYIKLQGFHNLNIQQEFADSKIIGLIGNNGSGKSSVLEGIMDSFYIALHLDTIEPSYLFNIQYQIGEEIYQFENERNSFFIYRNGQKDIRNLKSYMPQVIFTYYAGETNRLNQFAIRYNEETKKYIDTMKKENEIADFKFATALSLRDFKLAFLVHYIYKTECFEKIKNQLKFSEVVEHQIVLKLKKPGWAKNSQKNELWRAKGFQKAFFDRLVEFNENYGAGIFARLDEDTNEYKDEIWLGLLHADLFKNMFATPLELFIRLKALVDVELLEEVYIEVNNPKTNRSYDISFFSEGEKQLANLLMLLDLTKDYEALYLLDEFDAYLHPNWQREFARMISEVDIRGQVIFTTHSPATISGLRGENIFIMKQGEMNPANSETYNRSLDEIMEENMDITMRSPEVHALYEEFKQNIADGNKVKAEEIICKLQKILDEEDPLFIKLRLIVRRL